MATLEKPEVSYEPQFPPPPPGTYIATIIKIDDQFGVRRRKFQSQEYENVDVTRFYFGLVAHAHPFIITSREMKISGHERSNLYQTLTAMLGRAPEYGWDYCQLLGSASQITVAQETRIGQDG